MSLKALNSFLALSARKHFLECLTWTGALAMDQHRHSQNFVRVRPVKDVNQDEDAIDVTFAFPPSIDGADAGKNIVNIRRPVAELVSASLIKIATAVVKKQEKDLKKGRKVKKSGGPDGDTMVKSSSDPKTPSVTLWTGETLLNGNDLNLNGWQKDMVLKVDDTSYSVVYDPPTIKRIKANKSKIVTDCPYVPQVELYGNEGISDCRFEWFKSKNPIDENGHTTEKAKKAKKEVTVDEWVKVADSAFYVPTEADIGHVLKIRCYPMPADGAHCVEATSPVTVTALPLGPGEDLPFLKRQQLTQTPCRPEDSELRVVSYNLLADYYSDSDFSRQSLFAHCPHDWLNGEYRRQLVLREILGYNADVIMMQEVDRKMYRNGLTAVLGASGMSGSQALKKEVPEGLATFWNNSRFKLIQSFHEEFNESLSKEYSLSDIAKLVNDCAPLKEKIEGLKTVYQLTVLVDIHDEKRLVVVANTHLYFSPPAAHIRLIQMEILLRQLRNLVEKFANSGKTVSVILGGDFNSVPERGLYHYLTRKEISKTYNDWYACGANEYVGTDLKHSFELFSAGGTPSYTNFVAGFCGTLDYIYVDSSSFELSRCIPLPEHSDVLKEIALPNRLFPSDHLPLVVDLKWK